MADGTRRPGRPRSEAARLAILEATHDELVEHGYGGLTMERIAARAGVGKQTIYRWWRSKAEVALDSLLNVAAEGIPIPDEGDLGADLDVFLRHTFGMQGSEGPVLMGLLAQSLLDREFADVFRDRFLAGRRAALSEVLDHAVARGEIPAGTDLVLLQDMVYGVLWYRLLFRHAPLNDDTARDLASLIARSVRNGNNCTVRTV
ncbi:TetR/AcrR family transcriptional regulator [Actinoallomurus spadix]|uniref:TetR/AcrR family transcriptional regulator n=1 Tax=Actinoallomurus spadix TaxID=79912 RepID=A0ABN0W971_9ACTN|nr:TetR/AcrR family transcriptional regulator [Actinoallomurus spadix]MCO5989246.1 TetR/AcrR family transcriptional regulator [Actinoallomurus spadix]